MAAIGGGIWATQQLAEFLGIFGEADQAQLHERALERVAEALDAEIAALVAGGGLAACLGFPQGEAPEAALVGFVDQRGPIQVPGFGPGFVMSAAVGEGVVPMTLIVVRLREAFDSNEETLIRSMGQALGMAQRLGEAMEAERFLREATEAHAAEYQRLVQRLGERQTLARRLFDIQRSISHRAPLQEVMAALAAGAVHLLDADQVSLRIQRPGIDDEPLSALLGPGVTGRESFGSAPMDSGISGQAMVKNSFVIVDDYSRHPDRWDSELSVPFHAMAAPIHVAGQAVGALSVGRLREDRPFTEPEQDILLSLAEYTTHVVGDASGVDALRESLDDATYQARHDSLTGLLNRPAVIELLDTSLSGDMIAMPVTVLFVDLDRFKVINDVMGHATGDRVLVEVSQRLCDTVRTGDLVARLAGDEFVVVVRGLDNIGATALAERIVEAVAEPFDLGHRELTLTVSVGVAEAHPGTSGEQLLVDADVAMYRAKNKGRAKVVRFDSDMRHEMVRRSDLERELTIALKSGQLEVHYQPYRSLETNATVGFEALVRWNHPTRGLLFPDEFIPLAEETGQILSIDSFVLAEATMQVARWQQLHPDYQDLSISVNLSARQFTDDDLLPTTRRALESSGLEPNRLWLEITESVVMDETETTLEILTALRDLGVRLMVDDFGTGYSSLVYLKRFPVHALKVDREFVDGLGTDHEDEVIVTAVVRLAEALGLDVIAEGVETERQLDGLKRLGCRLAQGFLFARPCSAELTEQALRAALETRYPLGLVITV